MPASNEANNRYGTETHGGGDDRSERFRYSVKPDDGGSRDELQLSFGDRKCFASSAACHCDPKVSFINSLTTLHDDVS